MTPTEYQDRAVALESPLNDTAKTPINEFAVEGLWLILNAARGADCVKRGLFCEKKPDYQYENKTEVELAALHLALTKLHEDGKTFADLGSHRLLHAILGKISEAGEMLESLIKSAAVGEPVDLENFREEFGDDEWYGALGRDELAKLASGIPARFTQESIQAANLAKLNIRYKRRDTVPFGGERDLEAEKEAMASAA